MSDSEQSGRDPRSWATRMESETDEPAERITTFDSPHIPASRLGRVEHPVEMWPMLRMFPPEPNPDAGRAAEFEGWAEQFGAAAEDGQ